MGERDGCPPTSPEGTAGKQPERPAPRWTVWEIMGLLVSALLVVGPLFSLAYTFLFPSPLPAQVLSPTPVASATAPFTSWPLEGTPPNPDALLPTPTPRVTDTPTPGPSPTPTYTSPPAPTVPTVPTSPPTATPTQLAVTSTPVPPSPTATPGAGTFRVDKAGNKDVANHACPDASNPVVFEICRVRE